MKTNFRLIAFAVSLLFIMSCSKKEQNFNYTNGKPTLNKIEITYEDENKDDIKGRTIKFEKELKDSVRFFINCILNKDADGLLTLIDGSYEVVMPEGIGYGEHLSKQQMSNEFKKHGPLFQIFFDPEEFQKYQIKLGHEGEDIQKSFFEIIDNAVKQNVRISNAYSTTDSGEFYDVNVHLKWDGLKDELHHYVIVFNYNFKNNKWYISDLMFRR